MATKPGDLLAETQALLKEAVEQAYSHFADPSGNSGVTECKYCGGWSKLDHLLKHDRGCWTPRAERVLKELSIPVS